ncbi:hypothetical protein [Ruficoccus sp. ZRK36]|uniref:hypothetical protein n=1 Tax=Ruficoccus sp. ZRK36 TaxID=2866311 RepID=UPI001C72E4AA|nr:hypothetical protein [Ruficoccus sp. ZRK36]QYY35317.1 hypothetical protein K0V07_13575 [Ruficoccus sp. ZRK36]
MKPTAFSTLILTIIITFVLGQVLDFLKESPVRSAQVEQLAEDMAAMKTGTEEALEEVKADSKEASLARAEIKASIVGLQMQFVGLDLWSRSQHDDYARERSDWERKKDLKDLEQDKRMERIEGGGP